MKITNCLPEISTSSSRIIQEEINVGQGSSLYGALAVFLDANIDKIDDFAESIGYLAGAKTNDIVYELQHTKKNDKIKSFINRNIYLNKDECSFNEKIRNRTALLSQTAAEAIIKYGSRYIGKWVNQKDAVITCDQLYAVLISYISNARKGADISRAMTEVNKIRNSFPIPKNEKKKIYDKYSNQKIDFSTLNISSITNNTNKAVKDALAYYLCALRRQLYGNDADSEKNILEYYSLLDINGQNALNNCDENQYIYDEVATDQAFYLNISRGIMKNMFDKAPEIDMNKIKSRADELSKYDPYAVRRKKVQVLAKDGVITLSGIIAGNPEIALSVFSTALSQFNLDDEVLTSAKNAMLSKWGVSGNEFDAIVDNTNEISIKNKENDLNNSNSTV